MATRLLLLRRLRRGLPLSSFPLHCNDSSPILHTPLRSYLLPSNIWTPSYPLRASRSFSHGSVNLVLSGGKPKFEIIEPDVSKKEKWKTKKRLKLQRKRDKRKRKDANKTDPRRIKPKGTKKNQRFPNAEARIKYKIEKAKMKEAILVEKLKKYEVPKAQGPMVKPESLTGEERFYMKKMAQKRSNYVPVGRRGIFGGVILNMHLHWKKHETVKVVCKPCKPGQVHEYAGDIARLSGGTPIQIIGDDTIIFYRGKNYVQPEVMSPIDTLSKKKALEKSKYEQSLETVRRFIAISEKELELYYRHVALYGDPNSRNSDLLYADQRACPQKQERVISGLNTKEDVLSRGDSLSDLSGSEADSDDELTEAELGSGGEESSSLSDLPESEVDFDDEELTDTEKEDSHN